jgi:hypothetical protein
MPMSEEEILDEILFFKHYFRKVERLSNKTSEFSEGYYDNEPGIQYRASVKSGYYINIFVHDDVNEIFNSNYCIDLFPRICYKTFPSLVPPSLERRKITATEYATNAWKAVMNHYDENFKLVLDEARKIKLFEMDEAKRIKDVDNFINHLLNSQKYLSETLPIFNANYLVHVKQIIDLACEMPRLFPGALGYQEKFYQLVDFLDNQASQEKKSRIYSKLFSSEISTHEMQHQMQHQMSQNNFFLPREICSIILEYDQINIRNDQINTGKMNSVLFSRLYEFF